MGRVILLARPEGVGRPAVATADQAQNTPPDNLVADSVAAQLRRRREAAHRLPPLPSGHRDPLDGRDGPNLRRVWCSVAVHPTAPTVLVRGYNVRDVMMRAGLRPMYSVSGRGWVVDEWRLPDVLAVLEWAGYGITLTERAVVA